jgi:hypothetical protein
LLRYHNLPSSALAWLCNESRLRLVPVAEKKLSEKMGRTKIYVLIFLFCIPCELKLASKTFANTITYSLPAASQPGKFTGDLPLAKIGTVLLPDGLVQLKDDELEIAAVPDWLFDRDVVMKGVIVRAEIVAQQNVSIIAGLVYFFDGRWLPYLASTRSVDVINTVSGETIRGRVMGRADQSFVFQTDEGSTKKIDFKDVKSINSPRAFTFNIPAATARLSPTDTSLTFESDEIKMAPTSMVAGHASKKAHLPPSMLAGSDPGVSNSAIGTFIALDIISDIAPAIAIPLVLSPYTQSAAINEIKRFLIQHPQ